MSRQLYEKIPQEKLEAYLDGTLSEQETAEVDELVDSDKELQALVDEYFSIQIEMANVNNRVQSETETDTVAVEAMQKVINKVSNPKPINIIKRDVWIMVGAACVLVAVIFGFMVTYTPLSIKSDDNYPMSREGFAVFGEEVDYEVELSNIDSIIEQKEAELPSVAFFDRYKSDEKRKEIEKKRAEVYELQWNRMFILLQLQRYEELKDALKDYIEINGCHQEEAVEMLKELEEGK